MLNEANFCKTEIPMQYGFKKLNISTGPKNSGNSVISVWKRTTN